MAQIAALGVDAIGLVHHAASPRHVTVEQARELALACPPFLTAVALFRDATAEVIEHFLARVPVDMVQFHGAESASFCNRFQRPYIKAVAMGAKIDLAQERDRYEGARGLLVDTPSVSGGGSGERFDWSQLPAEPPCPLILAGGLRPENVAEAINRVHPHAVDVSSGVESSRGVKDPQRVAEFVQEVHRVNP